MTAMLFYAIVAPIAFLIGQAVGYKRCLDELGMLKQIEDNKETEKRCEYCGAAHN